LHSGFVNKKHIKSENGVLGFFIRRATVWELAAGKSVGKFGLTAKTAIISLVWVDFLVEICYNKLQYDE
jgi:hypothetical protein